MLNFQSGYMSQNSGTPTTKIAGIHACLSQLAPSLESGWKLVSPTSCSPESSPSSHRLEMFGWCVGAGFGGCRIIFIFFNHLIPFIYSINQNNPKWIIQCWAHWGRNKNPTPLPKQKHRWNIQHLVSSRTHWEQKNWQPGGHGHKPEETKIPRQENPISVEEREDNAW